jgi:hypothetical protein
MSSNISGATNRLHAHGTEHAFRWLIPEGSGEKCSVAENVGNIFGSELLSSWTFLGKHIRRGKGIIRERVGLGTYETAFRVASYGSA